MIRIVIADDHPIVRNGILAILSSEASFEVVAEAVDGADAYHKILEYKPNVAVVDMSMPKMNGIELLQKIKENGIDVNVIVLSNYDDDDYILGAIKSGAKAYLLKDVELDSIKETINYVRNGETYYSQRVAKVLASQFIHEDEKEKLTKAELKVLKEIYVGNSSKMIADNLNISKRTVETHRYRLMKKLDALNTADLIRITVEQKLI